MPFPIIYIVFFNAEPPRTQRIAEYIVNASAYLRVENQEERKHDPTSKTWY
jgi:hypothetical protein